MLLPTAEQDDLQRACRELLADEAGPERVRALVDSPTGYDADLWKQTAELGWTALAVPEAFDGLGGTAGDLAVLAAECGRALVPSPLGASSGAAWALARHAGPELRERLLPAVAGGEAVVTWALREPDGAGELRLARDADGLRLDGVRRYLPDAPPATHLLLDAAGEQGRTLVVVPAGAPGVELVRQHTIDLTRRFHLARLDGVRVAPDWCLPPGPAAADLLRIGVVLQSAESAGLAARLVDMTVGYAGQRHQFGRPIGSFQAVQHRIADMHIAAEGAAVAVRDAAAAVEAGRPDTDEAVHAAASWTGRAASSVASEAVQLHGGTGFTWEHDLHLYQRRAKANELLLGTPAWHDEQLVRILAGSAR
ncbi:hypothetical protein BJF78_14440 [Pseudonocardia sp. CNS-139]|nr:hypothetical protein BJF78_14440 [Pseudonocardia sp. CNS-139]